MEIWKSIEGFEGLYEISSYGRVKSLARSIKTKGGCVITLKEKFLRPGHSKNKNKYPHVILHKEDKPYYKPIHRLLGLAFLANPNNLPFTLHKNNDKSDYALSNLRWGTALENIQDANRDNLIPRNKGSKHPQAILNEQQVIQIKALHKTSQYTCATLARQFNVDRTTVSLIVNNKTWTHLN